MDIDLNSDKENTFKTSLNFFKLVFKNHDAVMLLIDNDTMKIVEANSAAEKVYGYNQD